MYRDLKQAEQNSNIKAVVVCGKRKNFSAGADIKEFDGTKNGTVFLPLSFM